MSTTALPHVAEAPWRAPHAAIGSSVRELDHRAGDGIDVALRWDPVTSGVSVVVSDERLGESLAFGVDPVDPLCAFHHPYA